MVMPARTPSMSQREPDLDSSDSRVVETHLSYIVFIRDRVYKVKKAVVTDFLDFRTAEARRAACEAEVALNRRLAPDVYLGVASVDGPETGRGGDPSDATEQIAAAMALAADEWLDANIVSTTGPEEASLRRALVIIGKVDF